MLFLPEKMYKNKLGYIVLRSNFASLNLTRNQYINR
jgi:hypothetical protein